MVATLPDRATATHAKPTRRIVFVSPDESFSSWRVHWPAQGLMGAGEEVIVLGYGSKTTDVDLSARDVVIVQITNKATRTVNPDGTVEGVEHFVRYIQSSGARVVLNIDDDYTAHHDIQRVDSSWYTPFIADLAGGMRTANLVVVATPVLEGVYGKWCRRITTVRNYPPERLWHSPLRPRTFDVGWMGYIGTEAAPMPHRRDFGEMLPYLADLSMITIGDDANVRSMVDRANVYGVNPPRVTAFEPQPQEVPFGQPIPLYEHMSMATLGLCPLSNHTFNASKSWIKALEFAIVGAIPVVPSWHPGYAELGELLPIIAYDDLPQMREVIDAALGAPEHDLLQLSGMIRGISTDLTMEQTGVGEWQRALTMLE